MRNGNLAGQPSKKFVDPEKISDLRIHGERREAMMAAAARPSPNIVVSSTDERAQVDTKIKNSGLIQNSDET